MNDHDYAIMQKLVNLYYPEECAEKTELLDTLTKSYNAQLRIDTIYQKIEMLLEKPRRNSAIKSYATAIFALSLIQVVLPQLNLPTIVLMLYPFAIVSLAAILWIITSGRD